MQIRNVFTLIATDKLLECRDFYVTHFGFTPTFETSIYIQLSVPSHDGRSFDLAFMPLDHPFGEAFRDRFNGKGVYLSFEVDDAAAVYQRLKANNVPMVLDLKDEPWGQRHFLAKDPGGTTFDVVEPIEPAPGYYDQYRIA